MVTRPADSHLDTRGTFPWNNAEDFFNKIIGIQFDTSSIISSRHGNPNQGKHVAFECNKQYDPYR